MKKENNKIEDQKLFSVIVPIYNVEDYLEETILSVVNQTIGFDKNIELILVNDGSPDNSEEICLKYKDMYPNNITYIKKKNGGVSSARNLGLKSATGKYVNFLDSDDKWPNNAFKSVAKFFETNTEIDVIACKLEYFEATTGLNHALNGKFNDGNRIIDLSETPDLIQMHAASCFIKRDSITNSFSTKLKYAEDALFINEIIMKKYKYGVLDDVHYMYRKRLNETSALDGCGFKKSYYLDTINGFHNHILKKYLKNGMLDKYLQHVLMYDLSWRIKAKSINIALDLTEKETYVSEIRKIVQYIDDDVILNRFNIVLEFRIAMLNFKHGTDMIDKCEIFDNYMMLGEEKVYNIINKYLLKISFINIKDGYIDFGGKYNPPFNNKNFKIFYKFNGKLSKFELIETPKQERYFLGEKYLVLKIFRNKLKLKKGKNTLEFYYKFKNGELSKLSPIFINYSKLNERYKTVSHLKDRILYLKNYGIIIDDYNKKMYNKLKRKYHISLLLAKKAKVVIYRQMYYFIKKFVNKKIWLISDRVDVANDNGEQFFKYVSGLKNNTISPYFVLNKKSADYIRMKKYGKVVNYNSLKYKILFLLSDKIISSQADQWVLNCFGKYESYYRDLYTFDYVFLQHGITKDDISSWLNIIDKNIALFVTSSKMELDSIVNNKNYLYDENEVKLTGMPRFDALNNNSNKLIAFMPTWRKNLLKKDVIFSDSNYYNFYNRIINDKKILDAMKKNGYKGVFVIHPKLVKFVEEFNNNDLIEIRSGNVNYSNIFENASLLITDYSSVAFDFAYLNKKVIYNHFDEEEFYENHTYDKGYFDYSRDGFGPVYKNYNELVEEIVNSINNNCEFSNTYKNRVKSFYAFNDKNCSERVYKEIERL